MTASALSTTATDALIAELTLRGVRVGGPAGALDSPVYDYVSLDYRSINEDLIRFSQTRYPDELWTDFNDSNFGTGMIENMAYASDLLAYNANQQNLETIPSTVRREQSFRNLAKSFDYNLKSASASSTTLRCTLDVAGVYPFTISKHLQFAALDGTIFQPDADVAVGSYPVSGYVDVPITQGEEHFEEVLGSTTGLANEEFQLGIPYLIDGELVVQVGLDGYEEVTNFIAAGATEKVYLVVTDQDGVSTLVLGDGYNGVLPARGLEVKATYKTGGGITTNLAATTIKRVYGSSDGSLVPAQILSCSNMASATGGGSKQSLANAKQNLPLSLKANDRAVSLGDYAALAVQLVPGALKAIGVAGKPYGGSTPVLLFVVPNGGGPTSTALRNLVIIALKDKRTAGKRIRVLDPVYVYLHIEADTFVQANSVANDVANKHKDILEAKFDIEAVDFGVTFDLQDIYDSTSPAVLPGIRRVYYKTFSIKPYFARHVNTTTTGNGTVENIGVDLDTVKRREWLVRAVGPLTIPGHASCQGFEVLQRRLGTVYSVTDNIVVDEQASYETNEFLGDGWFFHPIPEESDVVFAIEGNATTSITTAVGLLANTEPDDPYVIEKAEPVTGKIINTVTVLETTADTVIHVTPDGGGLPWENGDLLRVIDGVNDDEVYEVIANDNGGGNLTLDRSLTTTVGAVVRYVWRSEDESTWFSVVEGSAPFVSDDEVYVDTYPRTGDLVLRAENFPLLLDENVIVNPLGGVK